MWQRVVLASVLAAASASAQETADTPAQGAPDRGDDILVGVSYFAGWWEAQPNKWTRRDGSDWRPDFPERIPLLGEYNAQHVMDREIVAAAEYGVDFFMILWYPKPGGEHPEPNAANLERGLLDFMASPEARRMKFMVEFCNHRPYNVRTDEDWEACIEVFLKAFAHPSHLRIDGKIPIKVHSSWDFYRDADEDVEVCRARIERLREAARDAGLGELLVGVGVGGQGAIGPDNWVVGLFDWTGTYMDLPQVEPRDEDYPYEDLTGFARTGRLMHAEDPLPYVPYLPSGWNPRPWSDPRASFALPTRAQWTATLEELRQDLIAQPNLGFPGRPAFTIYAWNEFGEGGMVAPTAGEQYMKLEAIRDVFKSQR